MLVARLLIASVVVCLASSCTGKSSVRNGAGTNDVQGIIEIFPGGYGAGSIRTADGECYDLALPSDVLRKHRRWDSTDVVVTGDVIVRPRLPDAAWFDIRDRRIEAGGCSDRVIYVETITKVR